MALKRLSKTVLSALSGIALLWTTGPLYAAGTLPLAMAQQIDVNGQPLANCQVNFFVAGTVSTRQNVYSDFGLSQALSNPLSCDQTGRVPMFWVADGLVHVRLTDSSGNPIIDTTMQSLGPSSGGGGGGGGTVDPTTILATGDLKVKYGTGSLTGFVRLNGLTIGNGTSGATERANADTQNLFIYLYNADPNLVVSGGRTGNALNDYNASKTISLPDWRGYALAALGDMGNSATTVLTSTYAGCTPTTLGVACGNQSPSLAAGNVPTINFSGSGSASVTFGGGSVPWVALSSGWGTQFNNDVTGNNTPIAGAGISSLTGASGSASVTGSSTNTGGLTPTPYAAVTPEKLATFYIKL